MTIRCTPCMTGTHSVTEALYILNGQGVCEEHFIRIAPGMIG